MSTTRKRRRSILPAAEARALAAAIPCDPRTVQRAIRGEALAPLTAARVLPVLRARGLLPPEDANAPGQGGASQTGGTHDADSHR